MPEQLRATQSDLLNNWLLVCDKTQRTTWQSIQTASIPVLMVGSATNTFAMHKTRLVDSGALVFGEGFTSRFLCDGLALGTRPLRSNKLDCCLRDGSS